MDEFLRWLSRCIQVAVPRVHRDRHVLTVERLEPRQMFAVDCLFIVDVATPEQEYDASCGEFAGDWDECGSDLEEWAANYDDGSDLPIPSLETQFEDYHEIYLDSVIECIGELFVIGEAPNMEDDFGFDGDWETDWPSYFS